MKVKNTENREMIFTTQYSVLSSLLDVAIKIKPLFLQGRLVPSGEQISTLVQSVFGQHLGFFCFEVC